MRHLLLRALAAACVLIASTPIVAAQPVPDLATQTSAYLAPLVRTNNFSGVVLVARGGQIVFAQGYGNASVAHGVPNSTDTKFQIASLSKPFTSAAVMLLAQRGRVDLQAPLSRIIPDYPHGDVLTLHHLLSHTSGIPNINDLPEYDALQGKSHTTAELVAHFKDKPLEMRPGERYEYSNSNYNLLAHVIERVSGQPYGEFIEREITRPLRLEGTAHRSLMTDIVPGLANGYAPRGSLDLEHAQYVDWTVKTGNGSLYSTAGDLVRFVRALHSDGLLSSTTRRLMYTHHSPKAGYGWFLAEANGKKIHHLNGRSPGWAAQLDHYVAEDVTVVVLSNIYSSVTTTIARGVGALYFGLAPEPLPALSGERLRPAQSRRLLGTYRFGTDYYVPNSTVTITERDGQIQAEYPSGYAPSAYIPISPTEFIVRPFWMPAKFILGPNGRASELILDGFRGTRE